MINQLPTKEQIKAWRIKNGFTQKQAAAVVKRTIRTWQKWEHGESKIPPYLFAMFTLHDQKKNKEGKK